MVEQSIRNRQVVGSTPTFGSNPWGVRSEDIPYRTFRRHSLHLGPKGLFSTPVGSWTYHGRSGRAEAHRGTETRQQSHRRKKSIKPKRIGFCEEPWSIFGRKLASVGERQSRDDIVSGDGSIGERPAMAHEQKSGDFLHNGYATGRRLTGALIWSTLRIWSCLVRISSQIR